MMMFRSRVLSSEFLCVTMPDANATTHIRKVIKTKFRSQEEPEDEERNRGYCKEEFKVEEERGKLLHMI